MRDDFIKYQDDLDKLNAKKRTCWIWYCIVFPLGFVVSILLAVVPPLGIVLFIPCIIGIIIVLRSMIRGRKNQKKMEEYRIAHNFSFDMKGDATYCFISPFNTQNTISKIREAMLVVGEVTNVDSRHGVIRCAIRVSSKKKRPVTIYVEQNDRECKVRSCFRSLWNDSWWDMFLHTLFEQNPGVDFGVSLANGDPVVAGVLDLNGDTKQVAFSQTSGGTSLGGFLVGGALFGDAGAIVGGLSGKQRTVTNSKTVFSNELLVRVIYTNGRLWEGTVIKGSQLYHEIMVNMK